MPPSELEKRLKLYKEFLSNPPKGSNFSDGSYERRAYRITLRKVIADLDLLIRGQNEDSDQQASERVHVQLSKRSVSPPSGVAYGVISADRDCETGEY